MVYIDVRDRKFQLIFVLPVVLVALFGVLVLTDQGGESVDFVGVMVALAAAVFFLIYLVVTFVLEKMAERQSAAEDEEEAEEEEEEVQA